MLYQNKVFEYVTVEDMATVRPELSSYDWFVDTGVVRRG